MRAESPAGRPDSLATLLKHAGRIHPEVDSNGPISREVAEFLAANVLPGQFTLETGCGTSTVVLLSLGVGHHIAIAPAPEAFRRIEGICAENGIPITPLRAVHARSQDYLPGAHLPALDLVLIDGDHSFPAPFIDWYYTAEALKVGGLLIVDDVNIITGRILHDFLSADGHWEMVASFARRARKRSAVHVAAFRKLSEPVHALDDPQPYRLQPYVAGNRYVKSIQILAGRRGGTRFRLWRRWARLRRRLARWWRGRRAR
jgi:predicted O-methyltransferase YrrM